MQYVTTTVHKRVNNFPQQGANNTMRHSAHGGYSMEILRVTTLRLMCRTMSFLYLRHLLSVAIRSRFYSTAALHMEAHLHKPYRVRLLTVGKHGASFRIRYRWRAIETLPLLPEHYY